MRISLFLCLFGYSVYASAGPGPFGLEIDKSKFDKINSTHTLTFDKTLDVNNTTYSAYSIDDIKRLDLKGLHNGTLYFEKKTGVLKCVVLNIDAHRYADIEGLLSKKYRSVDRASTPLSDKYSVFEQANTIIKVDAPVLAGLMRLIYINKDIYTHLNRVDKKSAKELQAEEAAKL